MSTHLHESVRESLAWSDAERIAHLHRDRWVDYPRALETLAQLEALLATPPRTRMPCLLATPPGKDPKCRRRTFAR